MTTWTNETMRIEFEYLMTQALGKILTEAGGGLLLEESQTYSNEAVAATTFTNEAI